jgi:hypothetical protein
LAELGSQSDETLVFGKLDTCFHEVLEFCLGGLAFLARDTGIDCLFHELGNVRVMLAHEVITQVILKKPVQMWEATFDPLVLKGIHEIRDAHVSLMNLVGSRA